MVTHPGQILPRDPTGRYLHLKLKRYASKDDLTMPYAIKTWKETPHDAEVDCHKGCKQSAFFHGSKCAWEYPETRKLESIDEFVGWGELPAKAQTELLDGFRILKDEQKSTQTTKRTDIDHVTDGEPSKPAASSRKRIKKS